MTTEKPKKSRILTCDEGGIHDLTYLGRVKSSYRCQKCGDLVGKKALQAETN